MLYRLMAKYTTDCKKNNPKKDICDWNKIYTADYVQGDTKTIIITVL